MALQQDASSHTTAASFQIGTSTTPSQSTPTPVSYATQSQPVASAVSQTPSVADIAKAAIASQAVPSTSNTTTTAGASSSGSTQTQQQSRQAAELARKDRTLAEFMLMLDDYEPLVSSSLY